MKKSKIFFAAILGNMLEYYDFTAYSVFSIQIGSALFPTTTPLVQLLLSLGVFAVGFLTRPIGGFVFGYIGDTFGRKKALITSMIGMTIPTFVIGLLPSYESIGIMAPLILIIARLFQGLCISGEGTGTAVFILEHGAKRAGPGLITGFAHASNIAGTVLACIIAIAFEIFFPDSLDAWRYAFILGGVMGIGTLYLRLAISETPAFKNKKHKVVKFSEVYANHKKEMLITFFVAALTSSTIYFVKSYINIFYKDVLNTSNTSALFYLIYSCIVLMIAMPISGHIGDKIGYKNVLTLATFAISIFVTPLTYLMTINSFYLNLAALTLLSGVTGFMAGPSYILVVNMFKPEYRFTGVSVSWNSGVAVFGSSTPFISRVLVEVTDMGFAPGFYIAALSLFCLKFIWAIK